MLSELSHRPTASWPTSNTLKCLHPNCTSMIHCVTNQGTLLEPVGLYTRTRVHTPVLQYTVVPLVVTPPLVSELQPVSLSHKTNTYTHAHTYTYVHVHVHILTHTHTHTHTHMYAHTRTRTHTRTCTHARTHAHAHTHTHTHTCARTHTHTHTIQHTHSIHTHSHCLLSHCTFVFHV